MNRVFKIPKPFPVPDGTLVSPFLNPKDGESGLPFDLLDGFSLAAGEIEPGMRSKIHFMPYSAQVTFVRSGTLTAKMKGPDDSSAYSLVVTDTESVITESNTLLQLINNREESCEVLYIVTPPYIYEKTDQGVVYDDSVVLDETWDELESAGWYISKRIPSKDERGEAENRLRRR
jgi:mannose-6-phosphate isomerase-like protein (cupin superfamily)